MTTIERTAKLSPLDKLTALASDIDLIRQRVDCITVQQSMDDLLEVLDISELSQRYGVSSECMRRRLVKAEGKVFKMGRKYVIRKVAFLEVIENLERNAIR